MNCNKNSKIYSIIFWAFLCIGILNPVSLFAMPFSDVPESAECRALMVSDWFQKDITDVVKNTSTFVANEYGERFLVRAEKVENSTAESVKIIVAPCVQLKCTVIGTGDTKNTLYDTWPETAVGSWVLYRTENFEENYIRIYFQNNAEVYLQITPFEKRSQAELVIFGTSAVKNVTIGLPFEDFYTLSFSEIYNVTNKSIPWDYVVIPEGMYDGNIQMVGVIKRALPRIIFTKDAAYDEAGNSVFASTGDLRDVSDNENNKNSIELGSLGFVKWIADGLIEPIVGFSCFIDPLYTPTQIPNQGSLAATVLQEYNIYAGLDWIRNLAVAISSARSNDTSLRYGNSGVGVTSLELPNCSYFKKTGYRTDSLIALLYVLATTEPDLFYFGAITEKMPDTSNLHIYNKAIAIFPYFTADNTFHVVVFENGVEYTLSQLIQMHPDTYIDLVRVKSSLMFIPRL